MAKTSGAFRNRRWRCVQRTLAPGGGVRWLVQKGLWQVVLAALLPMVVGPVWAELASSPAATSGAAAGPAHAWQTMPRLSGRLQAADLGLLINMADPMSVELGHYYAQRRGIPEAHILRVALPLRPRLTAAEFAQLDHEVRQHFGADVQALALAWTQPYAVECNAITAALSLGFDAAVCERSCAPSKPSRYFAYAGSRPWQDLGIRPSMLLAARSLDAGRELVDRGLASDHQLGLRGAPPAQAWFVATPDRARNVRERLFPPAGLLRAAGVEIGLASSAELPPMQRVLLYQTGLAHVPGLDRVPWLPGALADHLTSFGGLLEREGEGSQMSALAWLEAGATASYGTVSEPCNHLQKFPHPQRLLLGYLQGVTALEAYWHSVAWPAQGVFIGDPLAAPFARRNQP